MKKQQYGYVRVSTKEQHTDRQMAAMEKAGILRNHIYEDKQSGKDFERPQYKRLIRKLKSGDVLYIKSIDRLGRDYDEIIQQWRKITKEMEVDIVVIDFPLLDTRSRENDLTGIFIADLVLQILSYVAQVERENIRQRQKEGIEVAKVKGIRFGRPHKELPSDFAVVYSQWELKRISAREAGRRLGVDHKTFQKWVSQIQRESRAGGQVCQKK